MEVQVGGAVEPNAHAFVLSKSFVLGRVDRRCLTRSRRRRIGDALYPHDDGDQRGLARGDRGGCQLRSYARNRSPAWRGVVENDADPVSVWMRWSLRRRCLSWQARRSTVSGSRRHGFHPWCWDAVSAPAVTGHLHPLRDEQRDPVLFRAPTGARRSDIGAVESSSRSQDVASSAIGPPGASSRRPGSGRWLRTI